MNVAVLVQSHEVARHVHRLPSTSVNGRPVVVPVAVENRPAADQQHAGRPGGQPLMRIRIDDADFHAGHRRPDGPQLKLIRQIARHDRRAFRDAVTFQDERMGDHMFGPLKRASGHFSAPVTMIRNEASSSGLAALNR